jgi:hypothetical protein
MKCVKKTFIDSNYGEEVEYIHIQDEEGNILIFEDNKKIFIIRYKDVNDLIKKLIESRLEVNFLDNMIEEQENDIEILKSILNQEG